VVVTSGTMSHGQSPRPTFGADRRDRLGLDNQPGQDRPGGHRPGHLRVRLVRQPSIPSRQRGRRGVREARETLREIAAHLLETDLGQHRADGAGGVRLRDDPDRACPTPTSPRSPTSRRTCCPRASNRGLAATGASTSPATGRSRTPTHGVVVELDRAPANVRILRSCVSRTAEWPSPPGREGPGRGGIAQGIAGALFEQVSYDDTGQPLCPAHGVQGATARRSPRSPSPPGDAPARFTESAPRGLARAAPSAPRPAVLNAVNDALRGTGVELDGHPDIPRVGVPALGGTPVEVLRGSRCDRVRACAPEETV